MGAKKTIAVAEVLEFANTFLQNYNGIPERLQGVEILLEEILHRTDNYVGYGPQVDAEGIERKFYYTSYHIRRDK